VQQKSSPLVQDPFGSFVPNVPLAARASYRNLSKRGKDKPITEKDLVRFMPNRKNAVDQMTIMFLLSAYHFDQLGDYDKTFKSVFSKPTGTVFQDYGLEHLYAKVKKFESSLAQVAEEISAVNECRKMPYPYLLPKNILNSISI
jgi:arachidonate 15-lipoxygenase